MTRLPEGYQAPKANSGYLKITDKKQKVRILSSPITGYIDWDKSWEKPRPVRSREKKEKLWEDYPKHFWAMKIWNYEAKSIQIREVTQASVRNTILALVEWEWWDPKDYDLNIRKKGEKLETEYFVQPTADWKKELDPAIYTIELETTCDLESLFDWLDPFAEKESKF